MSTPTSPILVIDSGLGGLTVVRALRQALPLEDILYFGDTARVPYGSKSAATVTTFVKQIIRHQLKYNPKHVVIACNTATALSIQSLRQAFPGLPVSGVIEPGARAAAQAGGNKRFPVIGVIATEATIRSKAYEHALARRRQHARLLLLPTPLIVPMIEEGRGPDDPVVRLALKQYLTPLCERGLDVLVLGCTHYPIYKDLISRMVGERVAVIDSADKCAEDVARRLQSGGLLRGDRSEIGGLRCFVTDDSPRFGATAGRFLGVSLRPPTWVSPEDLYAPQPTVELRAAV